MGAPQSPRPPTPPHCDGEGSFGLLGLLIQGDTCGTRPACSPLHRNGEGLGVGLPLSNGLDDYRGRSSNAIGPQPRVTGTPLAATPATRTTAAVLSCQA